MSDSDELDLDGGETPGAASPAKKSSGLGALLPNILKFVAIGLAAAIFIVVVVVVTFGIMQKGGKPQTSTVDPTSPYLGTRPEYAYYTLIGPVTVRTSDTTNYSVTVNMILGYDLGNNAAQTELTQRQYELRDFVRTYFSRKSAAELTPDNDTKLKNDIREILNTRFLDKAKIRVVLFNQLDVMEQM
ncbi:MAG: flagellar basal body-associated FliL family protein [Treponema sp.]|nr:flagellar basal body-associated FliL family protein [Treponema sp.]